MSNAQQWQTFANADSLYNPGGVPVVESFYIDGNTLILGGGFRKARNLDIPGVVKWNGNQWIPMGDGIYYGGVLCFEKFNNTIYACGLFIQDNFEGLCRFNGSNWVAIPNQSGGNFGWPNAIKKINSLLVIGGNGFYVNGNVFWRVVAFNGSSFINYGSLPDYANTLEVFNGEIYAGGAWASLKKKIGSYWEDVGGHCNDYIQDLEVDTFNNFLLVCGGFNIVDDTVQTNGLAIWNGFYWESAVPVSSYPCGIMRIKSYNGYIYTGLSIPSMDGNYTGYMAMWNGNNWHPVGDTIRWCVNAMEVFRDTLYVGGNSYYKNGVNIGTLGKWYMPPDTTCYYLQPRVFVLDDTLTLWEGNAGAQFYNNNAYADSWYWDFGDGNNSTEKDPFHIYHDTGIYNVSVTVTHGSCVKTATNTVVVEINTGVTDLTEWDYGFKVYPNPTTGDITVECNMPNNVKGEIKTFNSYGSIRGTFLLQSGHNQLKIKSDEIPTGVSLCGLYIEGKQVLIEKIVKHNK